MGQHICQRTSHSKEVHYASAAGSSAALELREVLVKGFLVKPGPFQERDQGAIMKNILIYNILSVLNLIYLSHIEVVMNIKLAIAQLCTPSLENMEICAAFLCPKYWNRS